MTKLVLGEIDVDYFQLNFMLNAHTIAQDHMDLFSKNTRKGQWLAENGIRACHTLMNNPNKAKCKSVVYADLTEHQQTDYILRFS